MRNEPELKIALLLTALMYVFGSCTPTTYTVIESIDSNRKCKGDCINGIGTSYYAHDESKILYTGKWKNGKENGVGKIHYLNGKVKYEGDFKNGFMDGGGKLYDENTGSIIYTGNFVRGLKEGTGKLYDNSGGHYFGQFANDHKEGNGQYIYNDKKQVEGTWSQNVLVGKNIILTSERTPAKIEKEAPYEFIQSRCLIPGDCKDGTGTFVYDDGRKYTGQFQNARRHGAGTSYNSKGKKEYEGSWANNFRHGSGILYYPTGEKMYVGSWAEGKKHLEGTIYRKDGSIYATENYNKGARTEHELAEILDISKYVHPIGLEQKK